MPFVFIPTSHEGTHAESFTNGPTKTVASCRWCGEPFSGQTSVDSHEPKCARNPVAEQNTLATSDGQRDLESDQVNDCLWIKLMPNCFNYCHLQVYQCDHCEAHFRLPQNLQRHLLKFHSAGTSGTGRVKGTREKSDGTSNIRCLEPGCGVVFNRLFNLTKHLQDFHGLDFQEEIYEFDNYGGKVLTCFVQLFGNPEFMFPYCSAVEEFRYNKEIENQISFINFCGSRRNRLSDGRGENSFTTTLALSFTNDDNMLMTMLQNICSTIFSAIAVVRRL